MKVEKGPVNGRDRQQSGEEAQSLGPAGEQGAARERKHWLPQNCSASAFAVSSFSEISKSDNLFLK